MSGIQRLLIDNGTILILETGVQPPDQYSLLLAEAVDVRGADVACDLTTGSGYHAITLAKKGCRVVAIDVSSTAASLARRNVYLNNLADRVEVRKGDLYDALSPDERFACMVAWPPVLPTPPSRKRDDWIGLANDGGPDGRLILDRILTGARHHLVNEGSLWLVHPWYLDLAKTRDVAKDAGLNVSVVHSRAFPMGVLSYERLDYIESLGRVPRLADGILTQEMDVLRLQALKVV